MTSEHESDFRGDPAKPEDDPLTVHDGRQSPAAAAIARGCRRLLAGHGFASLCEVPLPSGRRADIFAMDGKGTIWIIEVKSSLDDFRTDQKWPEYRDYCDHLLFAVAPEFPLDVLPADAGLIVADRFGGELLRPAPAHPLTGSRRRSLLLRVTTLAMARLQRLEDPEAALEAVWRE
jgi:hypothetical protein